MSYYNSNARYLTEYNQWLIDRMSFIDSNEINFLKVGNDIIFKQVDGDGQEFYTGSIYDPVFEAKQFLDGVNFDNTGYVLLGMGSSAIVTQILENKTETSWFLIIEKSTALVKKFLEEIDLSPYLDGKLQRVIILTELMEDMSTVLNTYINSMIGYYFLQTEVLRTFATYRSDNGYYELAVREIVNHLRTHMTSMGNSIDDTLMGMRNELRNIPISLTSHRLIEMKDKYKGKPAICVASGPSLDKQLPLLRKAKGKALIICAESAFQVLLKNGIEPDVVCILERGPNSYDLSIKGVDIPQDTALFGLTLMDERIPRAWNEYVIPIFKENIVHSRLLHQSLGDDFGTLYSGNSVAHLNYALAQYVGASPIVFIGQDLAFSEEGATHSKDSFYIDQAEITVEQRKQIQDSLQNDKNFFNKCVYLDGYYGGQVRSRELWRQFLHWMEHIIRVMPAPLVINATEGGADIKGTEKMPFHEVIEKYCVETIELIPQVFSRMQEVPSNEQIQLKLKGMVDFFNDQLGEMERISQFAHEIIESAEKLQFELKNESADNIEFLEIKAGRVLRNVETLLKEVLKNPFTTFFYRPLLSNYHVKMNPISRVSSVERLQQILTHQCYLLKRIIEGKDQVIKVYKENIRYAVEQLGFDPEEYFLDAQPKWMVPDFEEGEWEINGSTTANL
ncbi:MULTISPECIES: motility associated factor glycosyltransferase family protein [Brevibacillus]|uniref:motility associated factor glycosyltransferase family protein n=1 Tax=Brevibacillus TaxID=55080 RepID=UPI000271C3C1|nr:MULTISPECIES: 6-hydroxymethylpterin diphosphokinase MptE-like protein [Brevibacillus]EJL46891.1 hypothetical protein PMI08_00907 [Brevibacillus sp. CF112]MED1822653.1 DUF115 domain-containing protein [Brevibacillus agri]